MEKRWIRHFIFWLAYLVFEAYTDFEWIIRQYGYAPFEGLCAAFASETVQLLLIKAPMVYLLFYAMSRYTIRKINKWELVVLMALVLIGFSILARAVEVFVILPYIYIKHDVLAFCDFQSLVNVFMDKIFIAGVAIALKQYSISQQFRERESLLIKEKLETELNFLKSQVNPHFLFNTLNNIYSLALKKSDDTATVVVKLSKLLRYMLYETQHPQIAIQKEIHFLNDYIELEKIRYGNRLNIQFDHQTDDENAGILPLILVPFVENAFKHGASESTEKASIHIVLKLLQQKLFYTVENTFESEPDATISEGIGLKNLRRQLELRYRSFNLETKMETKIFKATLSIDLNQIL